MSSITKLKSGVSRNSQIDRINNLLIELASGNFAYREKTLGSSDELEAIIQGINMLGEELQESTVSRDYLDSIYRGVVDMLIVLSPDNMIQQINSSVTRLLGYEEDELIGKHISVLLPFRDNSSLVKVNEGLFKRGRNYSVEIDFVTKDGKVLPVSSSSSLMFDKNQSLKGILYIAKDISKLKQTERELQVINEELNAFVYKASHDLKGPLSSIIGLADVAEQDILNAEGDEAKETAVNYIKLIKESAEMLDKNLINLIEVTYLKQAQLEKKEVAVEDLVYSILTSLQHFPGFSKADIRININQTEHFLSDAKILHSVLQNLIENAFKYRKRNIPNPWIDISFSQDAQYSELTIADNGTGIPKDLQPKIFDMFFRASQNSTGSGLGLYIVKNSVEKLGGTLNMESNENGTRFTLRFPQQPAS